MNARNLFSLLMFGAAVVMLFAMPANAAAGRPRLAQSPGMAAGAPEDAAASRDTLYLLGGPDRWDGRFEDPDGAPNWHGWTGEDRTPVGGIYWHVSDLLPVSGQFSMLCGTYYDGDPGYGNSWDQRLGFSHAVGDPGLPAVVSLQATVHADSEPGYDYTYVEYNVGGTWQVWNPGGYDGEQIFDFHQTVTFEPGDYVGDGGNEIQLRFRFDSDGAWSDEDGLWDTDGACRIDDVTVTLDGVVVDHEDFEDGVSDRWIPQSAPGVGDFSHLVLAPGHLDPCRDNDSWMVCFVDDGVVVPGTGGTTSFEWDYGPGGFVLNWSGGLIGPDYRLDNHVVSPPLEAPIGYAGAALAFDVYRHQIIDLGYVPMLIVWNVRSTADTDPSALESATWTSHNFVYYGGPEFTRWEFAIHDQLVPDARWLQVSLGVAEYPCWGWCLPPSPAPYYDNVAVKVFDFAGPSLSTAAADLPRDAFPQQGYLDLDVLAGNSCRFDPAHVGGDSVAFTARPLDSDAVLTAPPVMQVLLAANPLFDTVRLLPAGFQREGDRIRGVVAADSCRNELGQAIPSRWFVDLPDDGFLYPGDELHYLLAATDLLGGAERTTLWPADTTGFALFGEPGDPRAYDPAGVVRYLPSVHDETALQPGTLLWNDADPARTAWWARRLAEAAGLTVGQDYDVFTTRSRAEDAECGLGIAATPSLLSGYRRILYTSGEGTEAAMATGTDPGANLAVFNAWLDTGGSLLLSGDGWAGDLADHDAGAAFLAERVGVQVWSGNQVDLLDGQASPEVVGLTAGDVFPPSRHWRLSGACPTVRRFGILEPTLVGGAAAVAEYLNPDGVGGIYQYAAAAQREDPDTGARVLSLSWDLEGAGGGGDGSGAATAAVLLRDILAWFDQSGAPVGVQETPRTLTVAAYPNPFNPRTSIRLDLPRTADIRVRIHDLRGAVVRTLHEGRLAAGRHEILWRGDDDAGRALASGIYVYEVKATGERRLGKLTLVR